MHGSRDSRRSVNPPQESAQYTLAFPSSGIFLYLDYFGSSQSGTIISYFCLLIHKMANVEHFDLEYGVDYDYVIESFYCEYKIDKDALKKIVIDYNAADTADEQRQLLHEFKNLYPEYNDNDISHVDVSTFPDTVTKKIYFVQSPKGEDGLPTIHYSLKEKMLSDLRATRGKVKKDQAKAEKEGDHVGAVRYNAKQLAIKVVCNSEYGASNNEYFAHYDPDIASAVTFGSRQLIGFLTTNLESEHLYVDKKFIDDNIKYIDMLKEIACIEISKLEDTSNLFKDRRHTLARLFDSNYNLVDPNDVYDMYIHKSTVVYQDTDSNYYINKYIINHFTDEYKTCSPEIIDSCMKCMLSHNNLMATFIRDAINRRPASLGFEGSFIICRYLNRKKKYYGVKWSEDGSFIPATKLCDEAYEGNVLKNEYTPYWKPKKSVLPQPNGEYLYLNTNELLHKGLNYLDYVHDYNIKCTGVDLARRDQYKFINYFHMMIVQKDLRLMKYVGDNKWDIFSISEQMKTIVEDVIETFRTIIGTYTNIAAFKTSERPLIEFKAIDFAKTAAYRQGKLNAVSKIVKRLTSEGKEQYIPPIGERMSYIVLINDITRDERLNAKAGSGNISAKSYVIDEIIDDLKRSCSEDAYITSAKKASLVDDRGRPKIPYDQWINAMIISKLDSKYYLECLCKSTALYMIGDIYPNEIRKIDEGLISAADANKLVTKMQGMIAKDFIKKYFHYGVSMLKDFRSNTKANEKYRANLSGDVSLIYTAFPMIKSKEQITPVTKTKILTDCDKNIKSNTDTVNDIEFVYKSIITNSFNEFVSNNSKQRSLYEKYKHKPNELLKQRSIYANKVSVYERIKDVAMGITFD